MSKTKKEMLQEMFRLQLEEDLKVQKAHGTNYDELFYSGKYYYAIFDELGELIHELKAEWCWWKKSTSINWEAVLEEFSDVTHFVLSLILAIHDGKYEENVWGLEVDLKDCFKGEWYNKHLPLSNADMAEHFSTQIERLLYFAKRPFKGSIPNIEVGMLGTLFFMSQLLGLDFETEVYEPYIKKNAINQQRVEDGY